ncbi:MAG: retropepsin-like aspartic protease [Proteobacteria bacterium]|nr:retropepsin-like aspartic protease [Pseudomonadota bacterium]
MKIRIQEGLPFISATIDYIGRSTTLDNILLDTGSSGTVFGADKLSAIGLKYEPNDTIRRIRGVGGTEFVFTKKVDTITLGQFSAHDFELEVGAMDYGFDIDGIIGIDLLTKIGIIIDLQRMEIYR